MISYVTKRRNRPRFSISNNPECCVKVPKSPVFIQPVFAFGSEATL